MYLMMMYNEERMFTFFYYIFNVLLLRKYNKFLSLILFYILKYLHALFIHSEN